MHRCIHVYSLGTWFSCALVVLGGWLDLMIVKVFSNLSDSRMIELYEIKPGNFKILFFKEDLWSLQISYLYVGSIYCIIQGSKLSDLPLERHYRSNLSAITFNQDLQDNMAFLHCDNLATTELI